MNLVEIDLNILKSDPRNARKHSRANIEAIKKSLLANPQYRPFVVQKSTNIVCVGNGMLQAMRELDIEKAFVEYRELDDDQFIQLSLADNRTAEMAEWDEDILDSLRASCNLEIPGFNEHEEEQEATSEIVEDEVPEEVDDFVNSGEVWLLGDHRLMCGDSTKAEDIDILMDGAKADMCFTDPPYGVDYVASKVKMSKILGEKKVSCERDIANDSMTPKQLKEFWFKAFRNIYRATKDDMAYYYTLPFGFELIAYETLSESNFNIRQILVWCKTHFVLGWSDYNYKHEPIFYGHKKGYQPRFYGAGQCKTDVWTFAKPNKSKLHPTMKPVELVAEAILNSTKAGDSVLDIFGGSGTTLIACEQTGRKCYMLEMDKHYVSVIIRRWEEFTGKKAKKWELDQSQRH